MNSEIETVRRKAQEHADFWREQSAKNESRASHYLVVADQFQHLADALLSLPPAAVTSPERCQQQEK